MDRGPKHCYKSKLTPRHRDEHVAVGSPEKKFTHHAQTTGRKQRCEAPWGKEIGMPVIKLKKNKMDEAQRGLHLSRKPPMHK